MNSSQNSPVKTARLARGFSIDQVAKRADLAWVTVRDAEQGRTNTQRRVRRLLALALDTPEAVLWPPGQAGGGS